MINVNRIVLIGAGIIIDYERYNNIFYPDDLVICADGGLYHAEKLGLTPDLAIGDFDSYNLNECKVANCIKLPCEKDDSDTFFAIKYIIKHYSFKELCLLGLTGGRPDHHHANLQILMFLADYEFKSYLLDDYGQIFIIKNGNITLNKDNGKLFSVFSFSDESTDVNITGAKYQLQNYIIKNSLPIGLSNEIVGKTACVEVGCGSLIVYQLI